jgi:carbonic anhydrase/acetyltransferase-like protein (isoleucine patch superfamily)
MNAVVMDNAKIGDNCIVGALCFVPANMEVPKKSIVVGNPAKIVKEASDEMIAWKKEGTKLYQKLPSDCYASLKECEPLRVAEQNRPDQEKLYAQWHEKM